MNDIISRQAAIDALIAEGRNVDSRYLESERIIHESDAVEVISMLPSAQPERKMGVWRKTKYRSICGDCSFRGFASWNYCPNCGRQMTKEWGNE